MVLFAAEHRFGPIVSAFLSFGAENCAAFLQISSRIIKKGNRGLHSHPMMTSRECSAQNMRDLRENLWKNLRD
jgi:hypothetical protein